MLLLETGTDINTAQIIGLWSISGDFTGWSNPNDSDIVMYETAEWLVAKDVEVEAGQAFKFRRCLSWDEVRTAACSVNPNTEYSVENNKEGSANTVIPKSGTYDFYINHNADKFYLMESGKTPGQK
jgi:hypothetical protein